jgi:hypothetical protein
MSNMHSDPFLLVAHHSCKKLMIVMYLIVANISMEFTLYQRTNFLLRLQEPRLQSHYAPQTRTSRPPTAHTDLPKGPNAKSTASPSELHSSSLVF